MKILAFLAALLLALPAAANPTPQPLRSPVFKTPTIGDASNAAATTAFVNQSMEQLAASSVFQTAIQQSFSQFIGTSAFGTALNGASITASGGTRARQLSDKDLISVTDFTYGVPDRVSVSDATMALGSNIIHDSSVTFIANDGPANPLGAKTVTMTGCNADGSTAVGTIASVVDAHDITVSFTCAFALPWYKTQRGTVNTPGSGYLVGDMVADASGAGTSPANWLVAAIQATTVSLVSGGSGSHGADGTSCQVTTTTGLGGRPATFAGTLAGGALVGPLTIRTAGQYLTPPSNPAIEPVMGCGLSGATVSIGFGPTALRPNDGGHYASAQSGNQPSSTSGNGTGLIVHELSTQIGGQLSYFTDNTPAFASAIAYLNAQNGASTGLNIPKTLYVPSGMYAVQPSQMPSFYGPGCVRGEVPQHEFIYMVPGAAGDVFSWAGANSGGSRPFNGVTVSDSQSLIGPCGYNMNFTGDLTSTGQQNAYALYNIDDFNDFELNDASTIKGSLFKTGYIKTGGNGFIRESRFLFNRIRNSGAPGIPCIDFNSQGAGDGTNQIDLIALRVFGCYGTPLIVHNDGTGNPRTFRIGFIDLEGPQDSPTYAAGPLMQLGNTDAQTPLQAIYCVLCFFIDPVDGSPAILITGNAQNEPYGIHINDSTIGGGTPFANGAQIDCGHNIYLNFQSIQTLGYDLQIGSTACTGDKLYISGNGSEVNWLTNIDATVTAAQHVFWPTWTHTLGGLSP